MKHRITVTTDELVALADRLIPISPVDYDLHTFSTLRNLYGRFIQLLAREGRPHPFRTPHNP